MKAAAKFMRSILAAAPLSLALALSPASVIEARGQSPGGRCVPSNNNTHGIELTSWDCFRRNETDAPEDFRLPDGDVIRVREEPKAVPADQLEIVLETPLNVTWWKEIKVYGYVRGRLVTLNSVASQDDDHGPKAMRLRLSQFGTYPFSLGFSKAKAFGVHTEMYWMFHGTVNWSSLGGKRITFVWEKDG